MRPSIGISSNFAVRGTPPGEQLYLGAGYIDAILAGGGLPLPLPVPAKFDDQLIDELLDKIDGLLMTGGNDLDAQRWGEEMHPRAKRLHSRRERFEVELFRRADARRMPILAVCLGHQVAHVARGGAITQHIENTPSLAHYNEDESMTEHAVTVEPSSQLCRLMGTSKLRVNSSHHQIIDPARTGEGLCTSAKAEDGAIEASEDRRDGRFLITIQWHPEKSLDRAEQQALFRSLVTAADSYRMQLRQKIQKIP
jgi:putative glutamine amidotransferase